MRGKRRTKNEENGRSEFNRCDEIIKQFQQQLKTIFRAHKGYARTKRCLNDFEIPLHCITARQHSVQSWIRKSLQSFPILFALRSHEFLFVFLVSVTRYAFAVTVLRTSFYFISCLLFSFRSFIISTVRCWYLRKVFKLNSVQHVSLSGRSIQFSLLTCVVLCVLGVCVCSCANGERAREIVMLSWFAC